MEHRKTFLAAAILWLALSLAYCLYSRGWGDETFLAAKWLGGFWVLCLLDLFALAKALQAALPLMSDEVENRPAHAVRALYWGTLKLVCLGLLLAILFNVPASEPGHVGPIAPPQLGCILGLGTMVFVPLVGGYRWSQRILRHA